MSVDWDVYRFADFLGVPFGDNHSLRKVELLY
jgi:hypothetical protein